MPYEEGTRVEWDWGRGTGTGRVAECYTDRISLTIKGTTVTRNATPDTPAYRIVQENGATVLKSATELRQA